MSEPTKQENLEVTQSETRTCYIVVSIPKCVYRVNYYL